MDIYSVESVEIKIGDDIYNFQSIKFSRGQLEAMLMVIEGVLGCYRDELLKKDSLLGIIENIIPNGVEIELRETYDITFKF